MDVTYRPPTPTPSVQTIGNTRPYLLQLAKEAYIYRILKNTGDYDNHRNFLSGRRRGAAVARRYYSKKGNLYNLGVTMSAVLCTIVVPTALPDLFDAVSALYSSQNGSLTWLYNPRGRTDQ